MVRSRHAFLLERAPRRGAVVLPDIEPWEVVCKKFHDESARQYQVQRKSELGDTLWRIRTLAAAWRKVGPQADGSTLRAVGGQRLADALAEVVTSMETVAVLAAEFAGMLNC